MAHHEVKQRVLDLFERVIARGEDDLIDKLVHPEFVNHEADEERRHGPEGLAATTQRLRDAFGEIRWEFHQVLVDGDFAAVHVTMHGTHEGVIPPGFPATHRSFSARHVHVYRLADDGRLVEHWAVRDDLGLMRQAGLLGATPS